MLKVLEEPPKHVLFFLCTNEPNKLKTPLRSRCKAGTFEMSPLDEKQIIRVLKRISSKEQKKVPSEVLERIAKESDGIPREAVGMLNQVIELPEDKMMGAIHKMEETQKEIFSLCQLLIKKPKWSTVAALLKELKGADPESIRRITLSYATTVLLGGENTQAYTMLEAFEEPLYNIGWPGVVLACYRIVKG